MFITTKIQQILILKYSKGKNELKAFINFR